MLSRLEAVCRLGLLALVVVGMPREICAEDGADPGLKAIQGTWKAVSEGNGEVTYTFEGDTLKIKAPSRSYTMKVKIDPKATPYKAIDFAIEEGPDDAKGKTSKGIYEIAGDRLMLCFRAEGPRPDKFEQVGFEQFLVELTNKAPKPKDEPKVEPAPVNADSPLPEGWPGGTKPGTIEIKAYPAYRSAVARSEKARALEMSGLFFPLFAHIKSQNIAMTTPVVMNYETKLFDEENARGEASMEFLYRRVDQGTAGPGFGKVKVEDHPAAKFACIGVQGRLDPQTVREARAKLGAWIADHKTEWSPAGAPRVLGYHGPDTPTARQLWEIQIPVKAVAEGEKAK